ncbi:diacylglycerol acyltransferase [Angomonas deanei]|nr:diacylglycerol acyltransferase [Angomonas deanei]|eukprot:EPY22630.1 diacylglycerol acyltransferase [Angomonas deanei]
MKSVSISTEGTSPSLSSFSRPRRHSLSEKKRPKRGRPSPTVVALTALWVLALVANFSLDIVLDLFQGHFQANEFPFVPIVFANILLGVFGVVIVLLVGKLSYKEYSVFQPFYGGRSFVFSQAAAYFILASAMALKFVLIRVSLITGTTTIYYGTFTVVGVFTLLSQVLLMTSLLFFEPGRKQKTAPSRERTLVAKNEILFIVTCNVVMLSCSLGAEAYPVFKPVNVFVTGMLSIAALLAIERITTNNEVKSYHFFTPTMETLTLFVGQCFANGLLLSGFAISGFLYCGSTEAAAGYHALCTMLLAGGICVHLIVLRLVVQHRSRTVEDLSSDVRVNLFAGPLLASLVNVLLVCAVVVLHTVHSGALSAYSASWAVALKELAEMTPELTIYMFVLMLFLPPFTHVQGRFIYTKDFRVWQPFSGTTEFILLQMAGWAAYGVLMFFGILSANATDETKQVYTLIFCGASILSQVCIHSSLYLFKLSEQAPNSPTSVSDTAPIDLVQADSRSFIPQSEENSMAAVVFNKEMMVAFALGIVAITIRVVCDSLLFLRSSVPTFQLTIGQSWRSYDFTREAFVSASTFLCLLSTLAAQLSIRHSVSPKINLSNGFVALQTFGWTFFSILAVAILSFYVLEGNVSLALQYVDHPGYMLWLTMEGFLEGIPFISFLLSGIFEFDALLAQKGSQKKVQASVGEVRKLLANKGVSTAESELCEQLLRAIAGPRLATAEELSASRRDEDSDLLSETAKVVSTIISVACVAIFSVAFLLSTTHPLVSLLFLVIGILLFTLSCVSIHVMYGGQLHRKSTHYSYFMPFTGGKQFVSLQAGGWVTYAISVLLVLTAVVEGKPASITCLLLSPLSVVSQTLLYCRFLLSRTERHITTMRLSEETRRAYWRF